jgi:hypothetical protein
VERLAARLRSLAREGPFDLAPDLMALTGLGRSELAGVVEALGFAPDGDKGYRRRRTEKTRRRGRTQDERSRSGSPFAALRSLGVGG